MDPTTAPVPLRTYAAGVADQPIFGRVCMYTVNETAIPHDVVTAELDAVGLGAYAPQRRPADVDVFRRVTKNTDGRRIDLGDGTYANVLIRDVSNDAEKVLRRLVIEVVDANDETLDYSEAYDLTFNKTSNGFTYMPLMFPTPPLADEVVLALRTDYLAKQGTLDGNGIRLIIKTALAAHNAVTIRKSGGVFFAPAVEDRVIDALHKFADNHDEITLWSFPLVAEANGNQANMLSEAFTDEAFTECQEMLGKLAAGVSDKVLAGMLGRFDRLNSQLGVYQELLEDRLDLATVHIESLRTALANASTNLHVAEAA